MSDNIHSVALPPGNKSNSYKARFNSARQKSSPKDPSNNVLTRNQSPLADDVLHACSNISDAKVPSGTRLRHTREMSSASTSSSDYSYDSETTDPSTRSGPLESSPSITKRSTVPSQGGSDRRRVAIVQMETLNEAILSSGTSSSSSSIRSRRGLTTNLAGLALVAPPDAALDSYTHLTPPSTAPIIPAPHHSHQSGNQGLFNRGHYRSTSESGPAYKKSIRDIGIIDISLGVDKGGENKGTDHNNNKTFRQPPIIEQPMIASRSPSPSQSDNSDYGDDLLSPVSMFNHPPLSAMSVFSPTPIITPEIGAMKGIYVPVAAPVVVDLSSSNAILPRQPVSTSTGHMDSTQYKNTPASFHIAETSAFIKYQPGVHSIAGPLPPPPRAAFNIDIHTPPPPRPPRLTSPAPTRMRGDLEAVKQALQLPPSVSVALAKTTPFSYIKPLRVPTRHDKNGSQAASDSEKEGAITAPIIKSVHRREGAFPLNTHDDRVSDVNTPSTTPEKLVDESGHEGSGPVALSRDETDVPDVTIVEAADALVEAKTEEGCWTEVSRESSASPESRRGASLDYSGHGSASPSSSRSPRSSSIAPSPPPKSFRNSLTTNLKRFSSLPRTPSLSSRSGKRSSTGTHYSSRTPSPSVPMRTARHKIKSYNPSAMFCREVYSQRTTAERCAIYTSKINELYIHDCGLAEWVVEMKYRGPNSQIQRAPSAQPFTPQPRHTSRSSMVSDATFPRRPDAFSATDLSQGPSFHDIDTNTVASSLPYPSLAVTQQRQHSVRSTSSAGSGTPPSSIRSLAPSTQSGKTGGFFASLGRKASLSSAKRERSGTLLTPSSSTSSRVLTKPPPLTTNISRPIHLLTNSPAPSGPRALPSRAQRSQTLMTPSSPIYPMERDEILGRRPSLFNLTSDTVIDIRADSEFTEQVDKLATLLPHVDPIVLAGYLRRAGQDVLAIGQYLEDEKNGAIKTS